MFPIFAWNNFPTWILIFLESQICHLATFPICGVSPEFPYFGDTHSQGCKSNKGLTWDPRNLSIVSAGHSRQLPLSCA